MLTQSAAVNSPPRRVAESPATVASTDQVMGPRHHLVITNQAPFGDHQPVITNITNQASKSRDHRLRIWRRRLPTDPFSRTHTRSLCV